MTIKTTRREVVKGSLALAGLGILGVPEWALPAPAQEEELVPFTDVPETFGQRAPGATMRVYDIRTIDGPYTPKDDFYAVQHFDQPEVDPATFRLTISGLVDRPGQLTLDELRGMGGAEVDAGYECSGNSPRIIQGLASNGRWTGVPLRILLDRVGVKPEAREFVFSGADKGPESVDFRGQAHEIEQHFARSLSRADGLASEPLLAYALNGEPLTREQGAPLRLVVPGW